MAHIVVLDGPQRQRLPTILMILKH